MSISRSMKRKILRKYSTTASQLQQKVDDVQNHVMSASISMTIRILYEKYGWGYDKLCEMANSIVDEYEKIDNFDEYAREVYMETGVGVLRTEGAEELERIRNEIKAEIDKGQ